MDLNKGLTCIQLPDHETIKVLNEYKMLLVTLVNKKLISFTVGGHTNYLSNSSIEELGLKNEICSIINSMVIKLPCFNVYSGIIISLLLQKLWCEPFYEYGIQNLVKVLYDFKILLDEALDSIKYKNNTLDTLSLQCILENILLEEPAILLTKKSLNKLSFEIVKGVLSGVNLDDGFKVGRFHVHVQNGSDYFVMINGVLCEVDDKTSNLIQKVNTELTMCNKMILFTEDIHNTDSFMLILKILLENNINLVICQKKISNSLKVMLRRNKVVVIERIGLEAAKNIEQATGCVPVCNINKLNVNDILVNTGYCTSFRTENINGLNYIVIENKGNNVSTLYVSCRSFNSPSYTKKVCASCIRFLCSMITSPYLLPGPIGFEEKLMCHLSDRIVDNEIMSQIISIFCNILKEIKCLYKNVNHSTSDHIGDIYHLKKNALMFCIDGVINFLSLGMIVRK